MSRTQSNSYEASRLRRDHAALEASLEKEHARPLPDPVRCADLKKRKLLIRDRARAIEIRSQT